MLVGYTPDNMALDQGKLKKEIQSAFNEILPDAFETAFKKVCPGDSNDGNEAAKRFGETVDNLVSEPLAERLSAAIDYYVKNAQIFGKFMILGVSTVGGPTAQAQVVPLNVTVDTLPTGLGGGMMPLPNMLYLGIK